MPNAKLGMFMLILSLLMTSLMHLLAVVLLLLESMTFNNVEAAQVTVMLGLGKDERRPCGVKGSSCNEGTGRH